jgi:hypothetical protein
LFVYISCHGNLIINRVGIPLIGLATPHFYVFPKPWTGFPTPYVMVLFMLYNLRWKVIVRFVDIGEIADHHCLIFVFISRLKVDNQNANNQLVDKHWKNLVGRQALKKYCWSTSTAKSPLVDTTKTSNRSANIRQISRVSIKTIHFAILVTNIMEITS